ncbi:MAG: Ig-like domain repeat protein [Acidimicrobiia bacterium]
MARRAPALLAVVALAAALVAAVGPDPARAVGTTGATVTLTSNVNPAVYGQAITLTARVTATPPATGTPTGTVTFFNGNSSMSTKTLSNGQASYTTTYAVGAKTFTASYNGDAVFATATSPALAETVNPTPTTTTLGASPNPSNLGTAVTFTATTTAAPPGAGAPSSGAVKFYDGSTQLASKTPANGVASFTISTLAIGNHTVTAVFNGSQSYQASTSTAVVETVNAALTTTVLSATPNPSTYGDGVTLTATVSSVAGTPTGTVTFADGSTTLGSAALAAGQASLSVGGWSAGAHSVTAAYPGTPTYLTSTSDPLVQQVDVAPTTTTVGSAPNPSVNGDAVTLTATVASGRGTPSGTVAFLDGTTSLGTAPLIAGVATLVTSSIGAGTRTITASYPGDGTFAPSTSAGATQVVNPASTTTSLTSGGSPSPFAAPVTFVAAVTSTAGTPTGTVVLSDGSTVVASAALVVGQASMTLSDLAVGDHPLTATYLATQGFATSTSAPLVQTVTATVTTTTVASDTNPASAGSPVTFTAVVAAGSGAPTGTVVFRDGATVIGTAPVVAGAAAITVATLGGGDHAITAAYSGDANDQASTSDPLTQRINAGSAVAVVADVDPTTFGGAVTFTATVTVGSGTATGTVAFRDGATVIGTAPVVAGVAGITVTTLGGGTHTVTVAYSGDATWAASTSPPLSHTVQAAASGTLLTSDANPVVEGQVVTLTATVGATAGAPTGTVTFTDGATTLGQVPLTGATAALAGVSFAAGTHSIVASYAGDANFAPSASTPLSEQVISTTSTAVTTSGTPSTFGQAVSFTATVGSSGATPVGTVTFLDGTTALGTSTLSGGTASLSSTPTTGSHSITAVYSGSPQFATSTSAPLVQVVSRASTATTLTVTPNPGIVGQPVTLVAAVTAVPVPGAGTVTFKDGSVAVGTAPVVDGQATVAVSALGIGTHALTATYAGTGDFGGSTSPTVNESVVAGTVFVDKANPACKNSGAGAGTAATPFCAINSAASKVTPGQTVQVAAGTYSERVAVAVGGTPTGPITFAPASGATVTITGGSNGFAMSGKSYVTIRGFQITATSGPGITVSNSANITIDGNHVSHAGQPVSGSIASAIKIAGTTSSTIVNNTTDHNTDIAIYLTAGSDDDVVAHNVSFANARGYVRAAAGIGLANTTGTVVYDNVSHDNEDSGFNIWTGLTDGSNVVFDNVAYNNGDHGIDVHNAVDARIVANTVYGNYDSGIEMTTSTGSILANNVSVDNGINSARTSGEIRVDGGSVATTTLNDDLVYLRTPGVMIDWNGVKYGSLAAFRAATGQESRGIQADPRFVSVAAADFHLLAGSPAIDSANAGAPFQPAVDFDGRSRVDDPATTDTGIGTPTFVDRGAFEYLP